jgi:putative transposase
MSCPARPAGPRQRDVEPNLMQVLHKYQRRYNAHRPRRGIANARPLHPLPAPITDPDTITALNIRRCDRLSGIIHVYEHVA